MTKISNKELQQYATDNFSELFDLRPEKMGVIQQITESGFKKCETYRFYTSYLRPVPFDKTDPKSYMYGDGDGDDLVEFIPLPDLFKPFQLEGYDQCTINWYRAGYDYIPMHSDSTFMLKEGTDIKIINLLRNPEESAVYLIENKETKGVINFPAKHGQIVSMTHQNQKDYRHAVGLCSSDRIAISFRVLK